VDLFEHQGKEFLARYGVPVPEGIVADTPEAAVGAGERLGWPVAVKAQVRAGGRGKAGGIRLASDGGEARAHAEAILALTIGGHRVRRLWVERGTSIAAEWYASFTLDRAGRGYVAIASARGGVDIEEVAATEPAAVVRRPLNPLDGLPPEAARSLAAEAGLVAGGGDGVGDPEPAAAMLAALYRAFTEGDAELVEVNPLVVTAAGRLLALDAKVSLDGNARFRHPEWEGWAAAEWHDERERLAREKGLNYVGLAGSVGVIGNGAGLVLATLDVVNEVGGAAANFLDVGGGAGADVISAALEVVGGDPSVRAILVNIFGGITRCDQVATGILEALGRVELAAPIVVRLDGTNAEEGRAILAGHADGRRLVAEPTMLDAARRAVALAGPGPGALAAP
jgi:succinyl-CoA synthetase beta subunit